MRKPALVVAPLLLAALLGGCATPTADQGSNPIQDLVDIIPWAKSVAADASASELTARIAELTTRISTHEISEATRTQIEDKLKALDAAIRADPDDVTAHAAELSAIIDEVKAAIE